MPDLEVIVDIIGSQIKIRYTTYPLDRLAENMPYPSKDTFLFELPFQSDTNSTPEVEGWNFASDEVGNN